MRAVGVLGPGGLLAQALGGYEHRPGQLEMADAVEATLEHGGVLLTEAGTGTGKTLAYLVPALLTGAALGRRVVVSTGTKALQDQIMQRDLPFLEGLLEGVGPTACMKGLENYVCLRRLEQARVSAEADDEVLGGALAHVAQWSQTSLTGDRAELDLAEDHAVFGRVMSSVDTRIGARCAHFEPCFVSRMRRAADEAHVVVVNHHLFFADLATRRQRGAGVIPDYDAVIFDEAHQIEDVATLYFGAQVSSAALEALARDALRSAARALELARDVEAARRAAAALFETLPRPSREDEGRRVELSAQQLKAPNTERAFFKLDAALEVLQLGFDRLGERERSEAARQIARRAARARDDLAAVAEGREAQRVTWMMARRRSVVLGSSPIVVDDVIREHLLQRTPAVVMTSATLATTRSSASRVDAAHVDESSEPTGGAARSASRGGGFAYFKSRVGIDFEVDEQVVPSPFDFAAQAALYVSGSVPDPRSDGYFGAALEEIHELLDIVGGGALLLCTSVKMMERFATRLQTERPELVLKQGDAPKAALLERFRGAENAVLVATASFWEGVDIPGRALRLVIIDRLPFDVPTDPLVRARSERLAELGEEPFRRLVLPAAALTLKQGFGRLIRSREDRGIVALLDSRAASKGYGKVILRSLPAARRCSTLAEVREAYGQMAPKG